MTDEKHSLTQAKAKKTAPGGAWRKVWQVLVLVVWVGVGLAVAQIIVGLVMAQILGDTLKEPVWMTVYSAVVYVVAGGLIALVPWKVFGRLKTTWEEMGVQGWPMWKDLGLTVVGFVAYFFLAGLLMMIFAAAFDWFDAEQVQDVGYKLGIVGWERMLAFVALVLVAPLAEEVIFRGWLYGKVRARAGFWASALVVSVLFGLLHGQWNVGVNVFAMSMVMCALREATGTIYAGVFLHMLKNGLAFYFLFVNPIMK
jgi:membrane protease YdiL (CAAX protease family)